MTNPDYKENAEYVARQMAKEDYGEELYQTIIG